MAARRICPSPPAQRVFHARWRVPGGQLMDRAKDLNFSHIALTDHGVLYGAIDFYKAAKKKDLKPIIGCEVYVAPR